MGTAILGAQTRVSPRPGGFGAELTGLDLTRPLPAGAAGMILDALSTHGVLWFPDQPLTHPEFLAFAKALGPLGENPFLDGLDGYPDIVEVRRDPGETTVVFGGGWHSDWSFLPQPPSATLLHAKVTPPSGGDTLFADAGAAWEALSPAFRDRLAGLRVLHSAAAPYGSNGFFSKETGRTGMQIRFGEAGDGVHVHPLAPAPSGNQRPALFTNPGYAIGIEGFEPAESQALLGFLHAHMLQDRFVLRHAWRPDMLTIWDNRTVLHCATGGYDGSLRLMHRIVLAGDAPQ